MDQPVPATLRESVYDALKSMILRGEVRPGDRLSERELTERLSVSRTPLREALNWLERDGFVVNRPHKGHYVLDLDAKSIQDMLELREPLEAFATRLAAERMTETDRTALLEVMAQIDGYTKRADRSVEALAEEIRVGLRIHEIIARASGNELLFDSLNRIYERLTLLIWIEVLYLDQRQAMHDEHRRIVDAVLSGDAEAAEREAAAHVRDSRENIMRVAKAQAALHNVAPRLLRGLGRSD